MRVGDGGGHLGDALWFVASYAAQHLGLRGLNASTGGVLDAAVADADLIDLSSPAAAFVLGKRLPHLRDYGHMTWKGRLAAGAMDAVMTAWTLIPGLREWITSGSAWRGLCRALPEIIVGGVALTRELVRARRDRREDLPLP